MISGICHSDDVNGWSFELIRDPPAMQQKNNQNLTHGRNQEQKIEVIKCLLEFHNQETAEIERGTNKPGSFFKLNEAINKLISVYTQISQ